MTNVTLRSSLALVFLSASLAACSGSDDTGTDPGDGDGDSVGDGDGDNGSGDGDGDGDGDRDPATLEDVLDGRSFELESADGYTVVADTTVGISFGDGALSFNAGCNGHFSDVSFDDDVLVTQGFGSTLIGCDMAREEQDQWFAAFFSSSPTVSVDGDRVTITDGTVTLVFLDDRIANPAPPLVGTTWEVNAFVDGEVAWGGNFDATPTITFNEDGTVDVSTGCNDGQGTYEHDESTITLSGIGYTERGCADDLADVEAHMQAVMQEGEVAYEFDRQSLAIDRGDLGVRANAAE